MRDHDWSASPLGSPVAWPGWLRSAIHLVLDAAFPMCVAWGSDLTLVHNDAYAPLTGKPHGASLGARLRDVFAEHWDDIEPLVQRALRGESSTLEQHPLRAGADGRTGRPWPTLSFAPLRDDSGAVTGVVCLGTGHNFTSGQQEAAEANRDEHGDFQAFQLELTDTIRALNDPSDIILAASGVLGRRLALSRVHFIQLDEGRETFHVRLNWTADGVSSLAGKMSRLQDFGIDIFTELRAGHRVVVDDVERDPRTSAHGRSYAQVGVRAFAILPLVQPGGLKVALVLQQRDVRAWQESDLQRAAEMAERTWSYVETARAQAALRAERDQSRYVFDSMTEGFALLDRDCTLLQMNAEARRLGDVLQEDVIGRKVWDVFPKVLNSALQDLYHEVMSSGEGATIEYQRVSTDEQVSWVEVRAYPGLDGGLAVFCRDINRRKRSEQKLKEADRRKDEFLAMLAHELRNPLAPIAAAAELLSEADLGMEDVKHSSEVITRQVRHMRELVNDLLDMSRVTSGLATIDKAPLDLNDVVPEALEQVEPLLETRGHRLSIQLAPEPAPVVGDRMRLVQVLVNLLTNAAKYTPVGGNLQLRIELRQSEVALAVRDDGIGMMPGMIESAFELFSQARRTPDRAQGGLGIGLALVKAIVGLHGGVVSAQSAGIGQGSEFLVVLPRGGRDASTQASPMSGAAPARLATPELKILIVDDNVDAARMLGMMMRVAGHRAFVEHDPKAAMALAQCVRPDVCLLDIGLPGMSGDELAQWLRAQPETAHSVLIAITGYAQALQGAFSHHLVKPIDTGQLLSLLTQYAHPDSSRAME